MMADLRRPSPMALMMATCDGSARPSAPTCEMRIVLFFFFCFQSRVFSFFNPVFLLFLTVYSFVLHILKYFRDFSLFKGILILHILN